MTARPKIGLFVTCLVDLMRPAIGFAAVRLLEQAGCDVEIPSAQTCCGQPTWNAGSDRDAAAIARQVIEAFENFDYVVVPSGSCAGMIRVHYPEALAGDVSYEPRALALAAKTYELVQFLTNVRSVTSVNATSFGRICYHDSCSALRELQIKQEPRRLLAKVDGLELRELKEPQVCCGFGGLFSVKYPEISERMADDKIADVQSTGAEVITSSDLGCLLHLAGRIARRGLPLRARHIAEILAGETDAPAMGGK